MHVRRTFIKIDENIRMMKIAILHDYIGAIGGGEKLVLSLARGLGADVITTDVD